MSGGPVRHRSAARLRLGLAVVAALGVAALGLAGGAAAGRSVFIPFQTPSKNIGCGFTDQPNFLRCDINSRLKPEPASCEGEYGYAVGVKSTGRAYFLRVGDTVRVATARILTYGMSWRRAGISCSSTAAGLRCVNGGGHGFFLSRDRSYLF